MAMAYVTTDHKVFDGGSKLTVLPDGKILVVAYSLDTAGDFESINLARYSSNGSIDNSFGTNGIKSVSITPFQGFGERYWATLEWIAFYPDGRMILALQDSVNPNTISIFRLDPSGNPDNSFNGTGRLPLSFPGYTLFSDQWGVAIQADGKVVFGCSAINAASPGLSGPLVARINANGTLDPTFNNTGYRITSLNGTAFGVAVQTDGKILVGAAGQDDTCVVIRHNSDGTIDNSYGQNGIATAVKKIKCYHWPDGTPRLGYDRNTNRAIVVGIGANSFDMAACRFLPNGLPDPGFNSTGSILYDYNNEEEELFSILVQPDSKIIFNGFTYNPISQQSRILILRVNANGQKDNTFGTNGIATFLLNNDDALSTGTTFQDGKLLLTGAAGSESSDIFVARIGTGVPASVHKQSLPLDFELYPNPSSGKFCVALSATNEPITLTVSNTVGQIVYQTKLVEKQTVIAPPSMNKGTYFIRLDKDGRGYTRKLIVD